MQNVDPYKMEIVGKDGKLEVIEAIAMILFEPDGNGMIMVRIMDNPNIPESWWRDAIGQMQGSIDAAMAERRRKVAGNEDVP